MKQNIPVDRWYYYSEKNQTTSRFLTTNSAKFLNKPFYNLVDDRITSKLSGHSNAADLLYPRTQSLFKLLISQRQVNGYARA